MLSYQHIYHAGGRADVHKHSVLCVLLESLCQKYRAISYFETHAGRGLYDLRAPESLKTGEASQGWLALEDSLDGVPESLRQIMQDINGGAHTPLYAGSPLIAARLLRKNDRLTLMELHPREHTALCETLGKDPRVTITRTDGYAGVVSLCPPLPRQGMVLIDPSYEIKTEYDAAVRMVESVKVRWPEGCVMLWYPLLPAGRHVDLCAGIGEAFGKRALKSEYLWADPLTYPRMYGSGIIVVDSPCSLNGFAPLGACQNAGKAS